MLGILQVFDETEEINLDALLRSNKNIADPNLTDLVKEVSVKKPLIYNVAWKTAIYFAASLAVRYGEHLIHFWRRSGDLATANRRLINEIVWPHFWGVQLWLLVLLLVYCTFRELVRALGRERVIQMFFHEPAKPGREE